MTNTQIIQTGIEIVILALLIVGVVYEPVVAKWEEKQKERVIKAWKQRKKYREGNKNV